MTKLLMNYVMTNAAIIADSSPLISLAIIEQLELLPQLYQRILLPPAVWDEVTENSHPRSGIARGSVAVIKSRQGLRKF